jgi:hypothetical protein
LSSPVKGEETDLKEALTFGRGVSLSKMARKEEYYGS